MDTISASEAARRLGTSLPRVLRAVDRLELPGVRGRGGRARLSEAHLERLRSELGVIPLLDGLTRIETQILAALARAPRGLASARAVARRAGVSPTAAADAIRSLERRGLVRRDREWVAAGRARELELLHANLASPEWPALAAGLAAVRMPEGPEPRRPRRLPARLRHLFWNADPNRLDLESHGGYIAERLVSTEDIDGLAWGLRALRASDWDEAAGNRGLSAEQRALARNFARAARE
ncbi:MAG TPA: MarR family transcriptional regulator [Gaiellaceae bacterium]|jgi:excisionase family DNA binding protein